MGKVGKDWKREIHPEGNEKDALTGPWVLSREW